MSDCTQFIHEARYQIEALLKAGHRQSGIATVLNRDKSTISREVRRNRGLRGYPEAGASAGAPRHYLPRCQCFTYLPT